MNNKIKRYLISTTAHLGDFIWATSAISILKTTFPNILDRKNMKKVKKQLFFTELLLH